MFLFILGRQPEIGTAELAAVFGRENIREISRNIVAVSEEKILATAVSGAKDLSDREKQNLVFDRLGSVVKIARVFAKIADNKDLKLTTFADEISRKFSENGGKITLGFSSETRDLSPRNLDEISLQVRKNLAAQDITFREIFREKGENKLNSASVFHNKLTGESLRKAEVIFADFNHEFLLAETVFVQNITSYTFRDRSRPKRDAKVGMLPPKLAQTIINLAVGQDDMRGKILLDAFVGTGVILQEAALMGMRVYGSDIEPRMIDYTRENLDWVSRKFGREFALSGAERDFQRLLEVGSATEMKWSFSDENSIDSATKKDKVFPDFVAGETYLGRAYATEPSAENLRENIGNVNKILTEFLKNLRGQATAKTGICLAVPAWFIAKNGREKTVHLPLLKELENMGFSRSFEGLVYHREGQIVGRELLVLRKGKNK